MNNASWQVQKALSFKIWDGGENIPNVQLPVIRKKWASPKKALEKRNSFSPHKNIYYNKTNAQLLKEN